MSWGSVVLEHQGMRSRNDGGSLCRALKNIIRTFDFFTETDDKSLEGFEQKSDVQ